MRIPTSRLRVREVSWGMEKENLEKELRVTVGEVVSAEEQLKACKIELEM